MQLLNTLYVTTPDTYLRLDNETLRVEVERETRLRVPLHHLCAVVCFGIAQPANGRDRRAWASGLREQVAQLAQPLAR